MILIIIGVCGSGKTVVGEALAKELGWSFADADAFHPLENKEKMSQGIPLTDEDRQPWLNSIHQYIKKQISTSRHGIVTCSALKRKYREVLAYGITKDFTRIPTADETDSFQTTGLQNLKNKQTEDITGDIIFVCLRGDRELIASRMSQRRGHFMPATLLDSQLAIYEPLTPEEQHVVVDIAKPVSDIVGEIIRRCNLYD